MAAPINTIRNQMTALLPRLRRFALSLTGDATDADDLVQDTVERALRNLQRWEDGTRLDSWMFRIAQNLWIDNVRARRVRASVPLEDRHGSPVDGVRDTRSAADICRYVPRACKPARRSARGRISRAGGWHGLSRRSRGSGSTDRNGDEQAFASSATR